jgi:hypothetical protein
MPKICMLKTIQGACQNSTTNLTANTESQETDLKQRLLTLCKKQILTAILTDIRAQKSGPS